MTMFSFKRLLPVLIIGLAVLMPPRDAQAQFGDDLYLFGFFQGQYRYSSDQGTASPEQISSFSLQQLNAFLMKDFGTDWSAFVNAELTNGFSSSENRGSLRLEEAWVRYRYSSKFQVKAGLLVPSFNNLNEIKNRTPLLPYIFRPMAYETSFSGILDTEGFAPNTANVMVSGALPTGALRFDYSVYVGNNSSDFAAVDQFGTVASGTDLTTTKLIGGRVGLRYHSLKAGVSGSHDERHVEYDLVDFIGRPAEELAQVGIPATVDVGTIGRTRVGVDLSFNRSSIFGEAEFITVLHDTGDEKQALLDAASTFTQGAITGELGQTFYYGLLGYNVTDRLFGYGMYNYIEDHGISVVQAEGVHFYTAGLGYRPIDGVTTKAQYVYGEINENPIADYAGNYLFLAVSVSF